MRGARPDGRGVVFFLSRALSREAARYASHRALPLPVAEAAWRYGASAHAKLGSWDDVLSASVDAAAAAAASAHWTPPSSDVSILGTKTLADDFAAGEHGECASLASVAREKSVFTYDAPKQCAMMMVCAGSPRAASTAHCMIAEHVLKKMMGVLASEEKYPHDQPLYTGYWNYHLHSLCDDGEGCELFDGSDRSVEEFEGEISVMPGLDAEEKRNLRDAMGEVRTSLDQLSMADAESVVVVKTHEFDARLMSACSKRLVLTSWRDKEAVFDSGLELGWFSQPKEKSRPSFEKVYDMWQSWRRCWTSAVDADPFHTRSHDLSFDALNSEDSFRAEVRRLAEIIMHVLNIREDAFSLDWIVDEAVKSDFQEELNPTMTNGNLPTEKDKAAGATPAEAASNSAPAADAAASETKATAPETKAKATDPTPAVKGDFEGELIEQAVEGVVDETATDEDAADDVTDDVDDVDDEDVGEAVGEVEAENDAVAAQIEEISQNVETLEATTKSKQGVVSSSRGDEAAAADGQQGGAWTRGGAGGERAQKKASADEAKRASARTDPDWDFEFESDAGTSGVPTVESSALDADAAEDTGAGTPEAWVSGASGFDDASGEDAF